MSPSSAHHAPIAHTFLPQTTTVKSTQSIANFTKEVGDCTPPFEPSITVDFTLTHSYFSAANPNPISDAATYTIPITHKPPGHTTIQISKDPSAFTPEQESPIFDYFNDLTTTEEHIQATQDATQICSNHIKSTPVNKLIKLTTNPFSATPPEAYHWAHNGANNFLNFANRITSSPPIASKKESRTTWSKSLIKKPGNQDHHS